MYILFNIKIHKNLLTNLSMSVIEEESISRRFLDSWIYLLDLTFLNIKLLNIVLRAIKSETNYRISVSIVSSSII